MVADDKDKPKASSGSGRFSLRGIGALRPEKTPPNDEKPGLGQSSEKDKK